MIRCYTLFAIISLFTFNTLIAQSPQEAPAEKKEMRRIFKKRGMQRIFNGKDLTGWDGDTRLLSVKD